MYNQIRVHFFYYFAVFVAHFLLFASYIFFEIHTDIQSHSAMIFDSYANPLSIQGNFLYFLVVGLLTGFSRSLPLLMYTSCVVLAAAVTVKYHLTRRLLGLLAQPAALPAGTALPAAASAQRIAQLSLALLFVYTLPNLIFLARHHFFYGHVTPNIWHNSTTIFLFPFALWLFAEQCLALDPARPARVGWLMGLVVLSILAKPSFFFAYAAITPFVLLARFGFTPRFWRGLIPIAFGAVVLVLQFMFIFVLNKQVAPDELGRVEPTGVALTLFSPTLWRNWGGTVGSMLVNIPVSLVCGLAFPIATLAAFGLKHNRLVTLYTIGLVIASCLVFVFITEIGPRRTHGNFIWQIIVSSYLLYLVAAATLLQHWGQPISRWLRLLLAAHVVCGILYVLKIYYTGSYT